MYIYIYMNPSRVVRMFTHCIPIRERLHVSHKRDVKAKSLHSHAHSLSISQATEFQEDLFPPTRAAEPALTAEEWFDGKNCEPKMVSMKPGETSSGTTTSTASLKPKKNAFQLQKEVCVSLSLSLSFSLPLSLSLSTRACSLTICFSFARQLDAANARIKELEDELTKLKSGSS